jgi:hypothetical protein
MLLSQIQTVLAAIDAGPDGSHADEAHSPSIVQDLIKIFRKLVAGQMSVSIKKRHRATSDRLFILQVVQAELGGVSGQVRRAMI